MIVSGFEPRIDEIHSTNEQADNVFWGFILPAVVRAGLVEITRVELGAGAAGVEVLLETGPRDLLEEIHVRCMENGGLDEVAQKNSLSPGTSAGPGDGAIVDGTATPAA